MSRETGQPDFRVRVFYPIPGEAAQSFGVDVTFYLKTARFAKKLGNIRSMISDVINYVDFDNNRLAFDFSELIADLDNVVTVSFIDWANQGSIGSSRFWVLPWATEWKEEVGWDLSSFQRLVNYPEIKKQSRSLLKQFGEGHFLKYQDPKDWLQLAIPESGRFI